MSNKQTRPRLSAMAQCGRIEYALSLSNDKFYAQLLIDLKFIHCKLNWVHRAVKIKHFGVSERRRNINSAGIKSSSDWKSKELTMKKNIQRKESHLQTQFTLLVQAFLGSMIKVRHNVSSWSYIGPGIVQVEAAAQRTEPFEDFCIFYYSKKLEFGFLDILIYERYVQKVDRKN